MELELETTRLEEGLWLRDANGRQVRFDAGAAAGGSEEALRPMQMLLGSLVACSSIDLVQILHKQRQSLEKLHVRAIGERREAVPRVFRRIHLVITASGEVEASKLARAAELAVEQYCSVAAMLRPAGVQITYETHVNGEA